VACTTPPGLVIVPRIPFILHDQMNSPVLLAWLFG